jgi:hypothetical protein
MEAILIGSLDGLYTLKFLTVEPREVKMVSNATVSVENANSLLPESPSCSFWHPPKWKKAKTTTKACNKHFIPREVFKGRF